MVATLLTFVGAQLGGVSVGWIVAPLLAVFIAYEVASLLEIMGRKVFYAVKAELDGELKKSIQALPIILCHQYPHQ